VDGVGKAKPEAEREAKGEASLLAEPCADLAALPKGAGGRTTTLKDSPLRLCALATLRFCLLCIFLKQRNPLKINELKKGGYHNPGLSSCSDRERKKDKCPP